MVQSINLDVGSPAGTGQTAFHAVRLEGSCSVKGADDVSCTLIGLAYDSGVALTSAEAAFADEVLFALPHLGLQKGAVSHVFEGGFEFHFSQAAYTKLWAYLDWLKDGSGSVGNENRDQARIVPIRKLIGLERRDEPASMVRIVDLSRSGVAFTTSKALAVGEPVTVGRYSGRIIRLFEGGAAMQFDEVIPEDRFDVMIDLTSA